MERKQIRTGLSLVLLLSAFSVAASGEKIQFSTPSQSQTLPSDEKRAPTASPNLYDRFRSGGAEALQMPMYAPQVRTPERPREDNKLSTILQSQESDSTHKGRDDKRRDQQNFRPNGLEHYVQQLERSRDEEQNRLVREKSHNGDKEKEQEMVARSRIGSEFRLEESRLHLDPSKVDRENFSFKDFWKQTTGMSGDRYEEQSALRKAEFQQIFERRSTLQEIAAVAGEQQQAPDRLAPAPTDFNSRTTQSSIADSYQNGLSPLNGGRGSAFDSVNARALGRDSSSSIETRIEQPKIQAQPAILPFPQRPGELMRRPGGY